MDKWTDRTDPLLFKLSTHTHTDTETSVQKFYVGNHRTDRDTHTHTHTDGTYAHTHTHEHTHTHAHAHAHAHIRTHVRTHTPTTGLHRQNKRGTCRPFRSNSVYFCHHRNTHMDTSSTVRRPDTFINHLTNALSSLVWDACTKKSQSVFKHTYKQQSPVPPQKHPAIQLSHHNPSNMQTQQCPHRVLLAGKSG